jgi:hypothetical protein
MGRIGAAAILPALREVMGRGEIFLPLNPSWTPSCASAPVPRSISQKICWAAIGLSGGLNPVVGALDELLSR